MINRYLTIVLYSAILIIGSSRPALSAQPIDEIRGPVDEVIGILKDPQYADDSKKGEQRQKIWAVVDRFFDFTEISKRTLARYWKAFTPDEQKQFVSEFSEFLSNIYIDRIQGEYKDETVEFIGQEEVSGNKALVKTKVVRDGNIEIPVDYRLTKKDNGWRVYDVIIEGVSLVKNYRTQFRGVLLKEKPTHLINILKDKNAKHDRKMSGVDGKCLDMRLVSQRCLSAVWFDSNRLQYHIK